METKICSTCKDPKPLNEFTLKDKKKPEGLRSSLCKSCTADYGKQWYKDHYKANRKRLAKNKAIRQKENISHLKTHLLSHPCIDCGETDLRVLDFDHVRGKKRGNVVEMAWQGLSLEVIKKEVDKCEVRCANDHRRRTYRKDVGKWRNGLASQVFETCAERRVGSNPTFPAKIRKDMQIKLSNYRLCSWYNPTKILPGTKVCLSNGAKSVGVIVGIGKMKKNLYDRVYPEDVTILWGTGTKRNKITTHNPEDVINYETYFAAVKKEYTRLEGMLKEVSTVGM